MSRCICVFQVLNKQVSLKKNVNEVVPIAESERKSQVNSVDQKEKGKIKGKKSKYKEVFKVKP